MRDYDSSIELDGVMIETMATRGVEMIIGARNDPEWGPIVPAGFGGVTAEILHDVRLLTPDLGEAAIVSQLLQLKSAPFLSGYRGSLVLDVSPLVQLIRKVASIMLGEPSLRELDLNPVIVYPRALAEMHPAPRKTEPARSLSSYPVSIQQFERLVSVVMRWYRTLVAQKWKYTDRRGPYALTHYVAHYHEERNHQGLQHLLLKCSDGLST